MRFWNRLFAVRAIREMLGEWHGLSWSVQLLLAVGYVIALALVVVTVFLKLRSGVELWPVTLDVRQGRWILPYEAMIASFLAIAFGWSLLLTGASDFHRSLFIYIVCLFIIQLFGFSRLANSISTIRLGLMWALILLVFAALVMMHYFSGHLRSLLGNLEDLSLLEFCTWLVVVSAFLSFLWSSLATNSARAYALLSIFELSTNVFLVFWFLLGIQVAYLAISRSRRIVTKLRRRVSERMLSVFAILTLVVQLVFAYWASGRYATVFTDWNWQNLLYMPWVLIAPGLTLWALILGLRNRWSPRAAATILTLSIASSLFTITLLFNVRKAMIFGEGAPQETGIVPPVVQLLLFVGLVTYNLLTFGVRYAQTEDYFMPRTGRVLVYPGILILTCGLILYYVSIHPLGANPYKVYTLASAWLQGSTYITLTYGMLSMGSIYLIWLVRKHRERLVDDGDTRTGARSVRNSENHLWPSGDWAASILGGLVLGWTATAVMFNMLYTKIALCTEIMLVSSVSILCFGAILGYLCYIIGWLRTSVILVAVGFWVGIVSCAVLTFPPCSALR
jgi:hypothetical protein